MMTLDEQIAAMTDLAAARALYREYTAKVAMTQERIRTLETQFGMTSTVPKQYGLSAALASRLCNAIRATKGIGRDLAGHMGVHPSTANTHLATALRTGLIKRVERGVYAIVEEGK